MHTSETDIYLRLRNGAFDVRKTLSRGQWGASQDDGGRIYRNSNESVLHVDLVPTPYFARNANLLRTRGSYESLRGEKNEVNAVWPARATPGVNRGYQTGVLRPDGRLASYTAVSAPTVYRGDRLPAELRGNVFVVDPAANVVSRIIVQDDGAKLVARRAYDQAEFLTSTDERFRPVYLSNAPDGGLYLVDMYHGIIQHRDFITEYLRDQILSRQLQGPLGHGRIYRIVHDSTRPAPPAPARPLTSAQLVSRLSHANGWWRDTAQRILVERGDVTVAPALVKLATSSPDERVRLHALWTLDGLDRLDIELVKKALTDPARDVRLAGLRLSERWLTSAPATIQENVLRLRDDGDWEVREQLAASLGALPSGAREAAIAALLERHGTDPVIVDAGLSGVGGSETALLTALLRHPDVTPQLNASITMTAATIVRGGQDPGLQEVFALVADSGRPAWQRAALMSGAEAALLGAPMPGGGGGTRGAGRGAQQAGATAPGGRGGPGSSPAFPRGAAGSYRVDPKGGRDLGGGTVEGTCARRAGREQGRRSARAACVSASGAIDLAGEAWRSTGRRAADGRRTATLCRRPRGLSDAVRRVSPARRPRPRARRAAARRVRVRSRPGGNRGPYRSQRQGRIHRPDATARLRAERRADGGHAHLHSTGVGSHRVSRHAGHRQGRPRTVDIDRTRPWTEAELRKF